MNENKKAEIKKAVIVNNKLADLFEGLLADRPLSEEWMEMVDEAIDYCIAKRYL